jgi:hypothetical protein
VVFRGIRVLLVRAEAAVVTEEAFAFPSEFKEDIGEVASGVADGLPEL